MTRHRPAYEISYRLYVDGRPTKVEVVGSSKTDAYKMLADQWALYYPQQDLPARRRCKLVYIERVRWG